MVASYIGYQAKEVSVNGNSQLNIVLEPDANILQEVVVTGMTKIDKRLFTGSSAHLQASDVKIDGIAEVSRGLEGRVAGVSVVNVSGTFGATPKILIRRVTSISGDSQPLWVVDGVIIENVVEVSADQIASGDAETVLSSAYPTHNFVYTILGHNMRNIYCLCTQKTTMEKVEFTEEDLRALHCERFHHPHP
ncbi:MAG: hypothetical protein LBG45_02935 [Dysgonamonadaceae bacterium]|nr:hypothetical protein [Dysgonamonadaceae bacterium]